MFFAVGSDPVKATPSNEPTWVNASPYLPSPRISSRQLIGTPLSWNFFITRYPSIEVCSEGLAITLLPHARAADICPIRIATGKFQGLMHKNFPFGL